jgi:hypothetical protein
MYQYYNIVTFKLYNSEQFQVKVCNTTRHSTHQRFYLDEIPLDHMSLRQMFVRICCTAHEQVQNLTWNCSLLYKFNVTIL